MEWQPGAKSSSANERVQSAVRVEERDELPVARERFEVRIREELIGTLAELECAFGETHRVLAIGFARVFAREVEREDVPRDFVGNEREDGLQALRITRDHADRDELREDAFERLAGELQLVKRACELLERLELGALREVRDHRCQRGGLLVVALAVSG